MLDLFLLLSLNLPPPCPPPLTICVTPLRPPLVSDLHFKLVYFYYHLIKLLTLVGPLFYSFLYSLGADTVSSWTPSTSFSNQW